MNSDLVSIILPVKNAAKYLSLSIESALNQTYKNIELIIIYSKSDDETLNISLEYKQKDSRVKIIYPKEGGIAHSLNQGINASIGKYIARMDSDDTMQPERIEKQLKFLISNKLDMCGSWAKRIGKKNNFIKTPLKNSEIKTEILFNCPFVHPSIFAKTSFFRNLMYDESLRKAEDYDLWARAIKKNFAMMNLNEFLINYRIHDDQSSNINKMHESKIVKKIKNDLLKDYCMSNKLNYIVTRKAFNGSALKLNELLSLFNSLSTFKNNNLSIVLYNLDKIFIYSKNKSLAYTINYLIIFFIFRSKNILFYLFIKGRFYAFSKLFHKL